MLGANVKCSVQSTFDCNKFKYSVFWYDVTNVHEYPECVYLYIVKIFQKYYGAFIINDKMVTLTVLTESIITLSEITADENTRLFPVCVTWMEWNCAETWLTKYQKYFRHRSCELSDCSRLSMVPSIIWSKVAHVASNSIKNGDAMQLWTDEVYLSDITHRQSCIYWNTKL